MTKRAVLIGLTVFVLFSASASLLFAAGQGEKGSASSKPEFNFYFVSHGGPGDPYWQAFNVKIIYVYPQKQGDVNELIKQLSSAIAAKPDGIGVTVDNEEGFFAP